MSIILVTVHVSLSHSPYLLVTACLTVHVFLLQHVSLSMYSCYSLSHCPYILVTACLTFHVLLLQPVSLSMSSCYSLSHCPCLLVTACLSVHVLLLQHVSLSMFTLQETSIFHLNKKVHQITQYILNENVLCPRDQRNVVVKPR